MNLPIAIRVTIHGRQAGKGLIGGAASSICLQEKLLIGAKLDYSHLVMKKLANKKREETQGFIFFLSLVFQDKVSLCGSGCPERSP